jgi:DNA-binding response OmpR family regulator
LPETFSFGQAEISRVRLRGRLGDRSFDLTPRELSLLDFFASRPGAVLSREKLTQAVWESEYYATSRTVDQHIAQLRKKIEPDPARPTVITTVHGAGYRYEGE